MQIYQKVSPEIITELKQVCGEKHVIIDAEKLENYSRDETPDSHYACLPEVVVLPEDTEQIAQIIKLANREKIAVVPRGAGTGLACGAIPICGGIVLSLERLDRILEINKEALFMRVQAGVRVDEIQKAARQFGLFYPGDPCSGDSCFIGGNLATNAGGNKAVKYGTTRNQIHEFEMVTPLGEIVRLGSRLTKNSTGYCLEQLIIGSEGTLGVITDATIKLKPLPRHSLDLLGIFSAMDPALSTVLQILAKGLNPTCIEFMDNGSLRSVQRFLQESLPHGEQGHYLIVQLEADSVEELENKSVAFDELCNIQGALAVLVADSQKIWKARRAFTEATRGESAVQSYEDVVVPVDCLSAAVSAANRIAAQVQLAIRLVCHAGDGNIHLTLYRNDLCAQEWEKRLTGFQQELFRVIYEMGGRLSGEHGIGQKRKDWLQKMAHPVELDMMRRIKQALDPNRILNPGKIFDLE